MKKIILQGKGIVKSFNVNSDLSAKKAVANKTEITSANTSVLENIDIDIYENDFTVIMGASGAGKSTLLYALSGMDCIDKGEIWFRDKEIANSSEEEMAKLRADEFGFVFQKTHLVSSLTLYENILLAGYISQKMSEEEARKRADTLVLRMNLTEAKDRLPSAVSGGEALRAAVARAVCTVPSILFADEPTGALNKTNSQEIMNILSSLAEEGQSVLLVTHDIQAAVHGNRILYLEDGRLIGELELGTYDGLKREREERLNSWLSAMRW